eukprot:m.638965 g.638965  ORF g.638965 m.638965 type:complete len:50 (-) comp22609_c0_seq5:3941-4090(-)
MADRSSRLVLCAMLSNVCCYDNLFVARAEDAEIDLRIRLDLLPGILTKW